MPTLRSAAIAALFLVTGTVTASAHARMTASMPKDGATVPSPLSEIALNFSHPMRLTLVSVIHAGDDKQIPLTSALPKTAEKSAKIAIDPLAAGSYTVSWTGVGEDGHVMKGTFAFSVK